MTPHNVVPKDLRGTYSTLARTAIQRKDDKNQCIGQQTAGWCISGTAARRPSDQSGRQTSMASLGTSLRNLSTRTQLPAKRPCTWCIFWDAYRQRVPMELLKLAVRSLAHGGLTTSGRSCFFIALPQICCSRNGSTTSTAPITQLHQQCKALLSRVSTMTFRLRNFISIMYPAQHKECVAFGASTNINDHAMSTTTGVGCTCRLICCRTFADAVRR